MAAQVDFATSGATRFPAVFNREVMAALGDELDAVLHDRPGRRLIAGTWKRALPPLTAIASELLGKEAFPVRAVVFDKSPEVNWAIGWHQDRTISVKEKLDVEGFGPWSVKDGIAHVEPPVAILQSMITVRLHIDDCDETNAPLKVAWGTHLLGKIPADEAADTSGRSISNCPADSGDVWAYSTLILHSSGRSRSTSRRRVLQIDYATEALPGGLSWNGFY